MDAPSSVDADTHQHNAWLVHCQTDGIRRAIARVPTPALARLGETVRRCLHRVERVQPVNLMNNDTAGDLLHNHMGLLSREGI